MPQPLVVDSGAPETVIPRTWFPNHKKAESEGSKRGVFCTTADGSTVENEGEKTLLMSTSDGVQLRKVTCQVANVNKALASVSKMVKNGKRVVCTSGSYIREQQRSKALFGRRGMKQGLEVQLKQLKNMEWRGAARKTESKWTRTRRRAEMRRMGDEEQQEEHLKASAIASLHLPSRREVEEHNLTHIPFRSWCNHCLRGRGRRRRHNEGGGGDDKAMTTYSIDFMYLTEEARGDESGGGRD